MNDPVIVCPPRLDIAHVGEFRDTLRNLPSEGPVTLDASAVTRVDGCGLQLLLAFVRHLDDQGRAWAWSGSTDAVAGAAELLGLTAALRLPASEVDR